MSAAIAAEVTFHPYRALARNRSYARLWLGQLISLLGDRLHQIALLVLVGALTGGDLASIGLVFATIGLPQLLFGLVAGALVDRWDRRAVMIAADLLRVPLVLAIPILARADLRWVYAITFLLTTVGLFFHPAKDAVIPAVVPERERMAANAVSSSTDTFMDVLGYPLAGALVAGLVGALATGRGIALAFYLDAATYAFSALMILGIAVPRARGEEDEQDAAPARMLRMIADGLCFVRSHRVLLGNTVLGTLVVFCFSGTNTLSYGYAFEVTGTGAFGYAILEAALGLGATVGGLAVGHWVGGRRKGPLILLGYALVGLSVIPLGLIANLWLAAALLALGGVGNMLFLIPTITLVQELVPGELLGRVMGLRRMLIGTAVIVANAVTGVAAAHFGVQPLFVVVGGLLVAIAALAAFLPSARDVA